MAEFGWTLIPNPGFGVQPGTEILSHPFRAEPDNLATPELVININVDPAAYPAGGFYTVEDGVFRYTSCPCERLDDHTNRIWVTKAESVVRISDLPEGMR